MATAPKSAPKATAPAPDEAAHVAPKKSKAKLFIIIGVVLLLAGGGGGAWYMKVQKAAQAAAEEAAAEEAAAEEGEPGKTPTKKVKHKKKTEPGKPPVFLPMDQFTVNLQRETGDQYLQIAFTLEVADQSQVDTLKLYMPQARSRLLLLLSGKKASEISSVEGKKKLAEDIMTQLNLPFTSGASPQEVTNVFFTAFVIQ